MLAVNIARICVLYYVGVYRSAWFATAHEEILPLVLIAVTALSFLAWARYLSRPAVRRPAAPVGS